LSLTPDERAALETMARNDAEEPELALRARIILTCATGVPNVAVAALFHERSRVVGKWRLRFVQRRLNGLFDRPRALNAPHGAVREFEAQVAQAVKQIPLRDASLKGAVVRVTVRLP